MKITKSQPLSLPVTKTELAERGGFEPHKIPPIITEIRTTTHKETHNFQSRQAPTCLK